MADTQTLKNQRDQLLAFAFASADLFLEVSEEGHILFALGAAKGLTGIDDKELIDKNWLEIFSSYDQAELQNLYKTAQPGRRQGPILVELNAKIAKRKAVFTSIKMPDNPNYYITLGLSNLLMSRISDGTTSIKKPLPETHGKFIDNAEEIFDFARSLGQELDISIFDFGSTETIKEELGPDDWGKFTDAIEEFLQAHSINAQGAAEIAEGRYTVLHDEDVNALVTGFKHISETFEALTTDFDVKTQTIHADIPNIPARDAQKALSYIIGAIEDGPADTDIKRLEDSIETYVRKDQDKFSQLKSYIERVDFALLFQPIIELQSQEVFHYEIITQFPEGRTSDWINFAEDANLIIDFDKALCERAINHTSFKAGGEKSIFSVNISAQSVESEEFLETLQEQLEQGQGLKERLRFEITQSQYIDNTEKLQNFIHTIKELGYQVILDDFGNNGPAYELLPELGLDAVKLHRHYIKNIPGSPRDEAAFMEIIEYCEKHGVNAIGKGVETEQQSQKLIELGLKYGQGYLFGQPVESPSYTPPQK